MRLCDLRFNVSDYSDVVLVLTNKRVCTENDAVSDSVLMSSMV